MTRIVYQTGQHHPGGIPFAKIDRADVVFAWLDPDDCVETYIEIGYALAKKKRLWLAANRPVPRLMFLIDLAEFIAYDDSGRQGPGNLLRLALEWDARRKP